MNQKRPLLQQRPESGYAHAAPPPQHRFEPEHRPAPAPAPQGHRWLLPLLIVFAVVVAAAALWTLVLRDDGTIDDVAVTGGSDELPQVVVIDESEVDVVQNPSLSATATADGVHVENDGNVTMYGITVVEGEQEVCAIESLSPGDGADCAGASAGAVVAGFGPQDQPVELTVG